MADKNGTTAKKWLMPTFFALIIGLWYVKDELQKKFLVEQQGNLTVEFEKQF